MTGSKIIVGSPSKVCRLILQLLSVFNANLLSYWLGYTIAVLFMTMTDKWMLILICGRNKNMTNDQVKVATKIVQVIKFITTKHVW